MSIRIALARPSDVEQLAAIELAAARLLDGHAPETVLGEATALDTLRRAQVSGLLWVALDGEVPVGFALVELLEDGLPHLDEIDVHPDHGRRGIGTALVRAVCNWVDECGHEELTLTTFREVPWNMPFYARMGFEELDAASMRPALRIVAADETRRGLDPKKRVAMCYRRPSR